MEFFVGLLCGSFMVLVGIIPHLKVLKAQTSLAETKAQVAQVDIDFYRSSWESQRSFNQDLRKILVEKLGVLETSLPTPPKNTQSSFN